MPDDVTIDRSEFTRDLEFTRLKGPCFPDPVANCFPGPVSGTNCVQVRAPALLTLGGTLTWASQNPTTERLEVQIFADRIVATSSGPNGFTFEYDLADQSAEVVDIQIDLDDIGRAENLPIKIELLVDGKGAIAASDPILCTHR